jgi:hypothetical protein
MFYEITIHFKELFWLVTAKNAKQVENFKLH